MKECERCVRFDEDVFACEVEEVLADKMFKLEVDLM